MSDHERPLNRRGRRSAEMLGNWLRDKGYQPDQVLCSSAARTRETLERLQISGGAVEFFGTLYLAETEEMLKVLRNAQGKVVLMLGHNPGSAEFASRLLKSPVNHPRFWDYPTGATLVAEFPETNWAAADFATAAPLDFVIPRELS